MSSTHLEVKMYPVISSFKTTLPAIDCIFIDRQVAFIYMHTRTSQQTSDPLKLN
jgi:hypothetical protein